MNIQLGMFVEDVVTRFSGIVTEICYHIEGHVEICITPIVNDAGTFRPPVWFNSGRISVIDDTPIDLKELTGNVQDESI